MTCVAGRKSDAEAVQVVRCGVFDQKVSFEWKKCVQNVNYVSIILSDVLSGERHQRHPEKSDELTSERQTRNSADRAS